MHDAVVSKLAASRGSPCDSMASCYRKQSTTSFMYVCMYVCYPMHVCKAVAY